MRTRVAAIFCWFHPPTATPRGNALEMLATDSELRLKLRQAARQRVVKGFSWNDYGDRAARIYQLLTNPKPIC